MIQQPNALAIYFTCLNKIKCRLFFGVTVLLLQIVSLQVAGCAVLENKGQTDRRSLSEDAAASKLSVFFNLAKTEGPALSITVSAIDVMADGQWFTLNPKPYAIDTRNIGNGQILLFRRPLNPGAYQRFRINIEKAFKVDDSKAIPMELEQQEIELQLEEPLMLSKGGSQSVFISFDARSFTAGSKSFQPGFSIVASQKNLLLKDLAFVACPDINTLYYIRTDTNWVYGSFGISGRPTFLAANKANNRLYVLAAGEAMIKVVEISSGRIMDRIQIPLGIAPTFMTVTPDGEWAYILDGRSDYLIRMHLATGNLSARVRIANRPQYLLYLHDQGKLAVSVELSQSVVLLDAVSLETIESIPVGTSPQGLIAKEGKLYIAGSTTNMVTVYDLSTRKTQKMINVGFSPRRFGMSDNLLYVANYFSDTISILLPGLNNVKKEITVGKRPLELAFSQERRWLYIGDESPGGLSVFDTTSEKVVAYISLDAVPAGLAIIQTADF